MKEGGTFDLTYFSFRQGKKKKRACIKFAREKKCTSITRRDDRDKFPCVQQHNEVSPIAKKAERAYVYGNIA
jgi:hypothetical protein